MSSLWGNRRSERHTVRLQAGLSKNPVQIPDDGAQILHRCEMNRWPVTAYDSCIVWGLLVFPGTIQPAVVERKR